MSEREGPILTDENGELDKSYLTCRGCKWFRVHDWHYYFCRDLGDKTKEDRPYSGGGWRQLHRAPHPDPACRFLASAESST